MTERDERKKRDRVSRRAALGGLGVLAVGCGSASEEGTPGEETPIKDGTLPPPGGDPVPGPKAETPPLQPKELLAGIEHIVVLMMENRSFDHYLGALKSDAAYPAKAEVDGLAGTESNPAPAGGTDVAVFKMANFTPDDPPHGWDAAHAQWNGGVNDGFVKAHEGPSQSEAMGYHDRSQIPLYYWFADNFAVCDRWFSSVLGPTWPNRFFLHAATSGGNKGNTPLFGQTPTIWDRLKAKGISVKNYAAGLANWALGGFPGRHLDIRAPISAFFDAAANGTLPQFSIIDPDYQANDDHPSHNILRGQAFVASIYKALAESSLWSKTLFIITYDENGGFYDHVPPPKVSDERAEFQQLGFRVPAFVIGPTVKKGYVCKTQLEHVSVAATLRTRFDIADLNTRMKETNDISDCIDSAKVKMPAAPPAGMPVVAMTMDAALHDGVGTSSQPALDAMIARGLVPVVNSQNHSQRIGDWLEHAVRLGAIRIVGS